MVQNQRETMMRFFSASSASDETHFSFTATATCHPVSCQSDQCVLEYTIARLCVNCVNGA